MARVVDNETRRPIPNEDTFHGRSDLSPKSTVTARNQYRRDFYRSHTENEREVKE